MYNMYMMEFTSAEMKSLMDSAASDLHNLSMVVLNKIVMETRAGPLTFLI